MSSAGESLQNRFDRARDLAPDERERFLAGLAAAEPESAARLRQLLAAADGGRSPLDATPWETLADEPLPAAIGPYRVLSELGRGGMGRVYLALQEGEGFARRLAVKVVAPEGAGAEIERRFRDERRILAALDHPGIARFHDAGRDAGGRWYLALEFVEGESLLDHARSHRLGTGERLRLFRAVLAAVAYAHERSVVHRDLKPANILVGADGRPRLLDFGIAKLVDAGSDGAATQTRTALRAFTPAYASPEQIRGESVTPASDVFSLGVVLYELLAGVRPFGGDAGSRVAIERQILDTDPEPPSTASRRAAAAAPGGAPPAGRLSRDLDAICLKALAKEPEERYRSAAELAADLERLESGLPVVARGRAPRYRLARFVARRRAAVAVASAFAVAAIAVVFALASLRSRPVVPPAEPAPRPFPLNGVSSKDAAALESAFTAAPADVEGGARLAVALEKAGRIDEGLLIVARLRQIPGHAEDPLVDYVEATLAASSKESQRALVLFGSALDRALAGGRGELVAQVRASRGRLLYLLGRRDEARRDMESARRSFEAARDPASLARVLNDLAIDPLSSGRLAEGEVLLEQALAASRESGAGGAGIISMNLAMVAIQRGFPDRAEPRLRESVAAFRQSQSRRLGFALLSLSQALAELGREPEAGVELARAIEVLSAGAAERDLSYGLHDRGSAELAAGKLDRAEATARQLDELAKGSGDLSALAFSNQLRGELAAKSGDLEEARRRLGEAHRQLVDSSEGDFAEELDVTWAAIELAAGELAAARAIANRLRPDPAAPIEKNTQFLAEATLAQLDAREGRKDDAAGRLALLEAAAAGTTSVRRIRALDEARATAATAKS